MTTRREFLHTTGTLAGLVFVGRDLLADRPAHAQVRRREVVVSGRRVRTVDVHAHCAVPEALALMNLKLAGPGLRTDLDMATQVLVRLQAMDEQGIDVEALSINPNWYKVDRDLAEADHPDPEREARRRLRRQPRPLRGLRHGGAAVPRARRRAARGGREEVRPPRRRHRRQRGGAGDQRPEVLPLLGQGGSARRARLHPSPGRRARRRSSSRASRATAIWAT